MPSATRTAVLAQAPEGALAQVVEHPLRLRLRRAAGGRQHLAEQIAGTILVADALELLGQLHLARDRIRPGVVLDERLVDAADRGVARLVEVEADAGEIEGERRVARIGTRRSARLVRGQWHLVRRLLEAGRDRTRRIRLGGVERGRLRG